MQRVNWWQDRFILCLLWLGILVQAKLLGILFALKQYYATYQSYPLWSTLVRVLIMTAVVIVKNKSFFLPKFDCVGSSSSSSERKFWSLKK